MPIILGSTSGSPTFANKGFITARQVATPFEQMLNQIGPILQQAGVTLTSNVIPIYGFKGPAHGYMGSLTYRAGKQIADRYDPYQKITVQVTPALQLQCILPQLTQGSLVSVLASDPEGWLLRGAEDALMMLLFSLGRLIQSAAFLPYEVEWTCLTGRWNSECQFPLDDGTIVGRRNPPL
jgi:hypothetical protein